MSEVLEWIELGTSAYSFSVYLLCFLLVVLVLKFNKPGSAKYKLPPSPSKLPIVGNLHQLRDPIHHAFSFLAQKHGPIMLLHLGCVRTVVVSSSDTARDVMKTYDHVFSSRPQLMIHKRLLFGKDVAFAPYGEYWRQARKISILHFLAAKKVQSFKFVREEEIALMIENVEHLSRLSLVNLSKMLVSVTNSIICRAALGKKYNHGEGGRKVEAMLKEFTYLLGVSNIGELIPSLLWVNYLNGLNSRVEKNFKELDSFFDQVVEEHLEKKRRQPDDARCEYDEEEVDLLDVLVLMEKDETLDISISRDSTKAIILDMFGGVDTASAVIEWAMSELIRHPEIMKEVQKEVRALAEGKLILKETDIEEMHYLRLVIKETLRLHPPIALVPRESTQSAQIQGYDIPAKSRIMINAYAIGRDPVLWEEPEKFLPNRFSNNRDAWNSLKDQNFNHIPFGSGRRMCPGIIFGTSIVELALANLINRFDWALPTGMGGKDLDMHELSGITVHRKEDLVLAATCETALRQGMN